MKPSFLKEGSAELTARFGGTFVSIRSGDIALPVYVREIIDVSWEGGTITISGTIVDAATKEWTPFLETIKETNLDYFPPKPGFRNMEKIAVYYDIVPVRHRYRGLRREQIRLRYPDSSQEDEVGLDSSGFQYRLFNPEYTNVGSALELVGKRKRSSMAFSEKFAVLRSKMFKHLVFVYKNKPIGLYLKGDNVVVLPTNAHHLSDELSLYIPCVKDKI